MVKTRPIQLPGRWRMGYALDYHTISSVYIGDDELGHPQFETKRSETGELLYQLKYRTDAAMVQPLVEAAASFLEGWCPGVDLIVPVPPSKPRASQPVLMLAAALAQRTGLPCSPSAVIRSRDAPELKNVYAYDERLEHLAGAHAVDTAQVGGLRILLFDDLYRSGATMSAICSALYDEGAAAEVFALTITRTRSNR